MTCLGAQAARRVTLRIPIPCPTVAGRSISTSTTTTSSSSSSSPSSTSIPAPAAPPHHPHQSDTQSLLLPHNRTLSYATWGDPTHSPLLFLHGFPGSRLEISAVASQITSHNVFLISPDRPGFGRSSPLPWRTIAQYPTDLGSLLDHLSLDRVVMLGGSGGGPYALACGASLRSRIAALGVLASAPPWTSGLAGMPFSSRLLRAASTTAPSLTAGIAGTAAALSKWMAERSVGRIDRWLENKGVPHDHVEEVRKETMRTVFEGFAQGPTPAVEEAVLLSQDWGFDLEQVKVGEIGEERPVRIWHGVNDARAPIQFIRWMANRIPHAELKELDSGHFGASAVLDEVVRTLMEDAGWSWGRGEVKS